MCLVLFFGCGVTPGGAQQLFLFLHPGLTLDRHTISICKINGLPIAQSCLFVFSESCLLFFYFYSTIVFSVLDHIQCCSGLTPGSNSETIYHGGTHIGC